MDEPRPHIEPMPAFDGDGSITSEELASLRPTLNVAERDLFDQLQADAPGFLEGLSERDLERVADGDLSLAEAVSAHPALDALSPQTIERLIDEGQLATFVRLNGEMHPERMRDLPDLDPEVRQAADEMLASYAEGQREQLQRDQELGQQVWEHETRR